MYERERYPQYKMEQMGKDIESCFRDGWLTHGDINKLYK